MVLASEVNGMPIDKTKVALLYTETSGGTMSASYLIAQSNDPLCPSGWRYTDRAETEMEICGTTCQRIQRTPDARLDVAFACNLEVPL